MQNKIKYITAFDPQIKTRVPHVVINNRAISLVTRNTFRYTKPKK